jgi:hypothetical protein
MAESLTPPNLDPEHFDRQHLFFLNRVTVHDQAETQQEWHAACAACLERDAAIAALLANDPDNAAKLFISAGRRFLRLGVFAGLPLSKFGYIGKRWHWRDQFADGGSGVEQAIRASSASDELERGKASHDQIIHVSAPFLMASARSPTQLLHLYYALNSAQDEHGDLYHRVRTLLLHLPETNVGAAEIPFVRYIRLLDEIGAMSKAKSSQLSQRSSDTFRLALLRRNEQLEAAQTDRTHWNLLPNPGNLIDLDLMALGALLIERTGTTAAFDEVVEGVDPMLYIPFRAAEKLSRRS